MARKCLCVAERFLISLRLARCGELFFPRSLGDALSGGQSAAAHHTITIISFTTPTNTDIMKSITKFILSAVLLITVTTNALSQNNSGNWQYLGKVTAVTSIKPTYNNKDIKEDREVVFVYQTFDGEKVKYRILVPRTECTYDVHKSSSYDGSQVKWSPSGNYVRYIPSLSSMYTHWAGPYHFNISYVKP